MATLKELQDKCVEVTHQYVDKAREKFNLAVPYPVIRFDVKGSVAGWAYHHKNLIRFNPIMLLDNADAFLYDTPGHEVAHIIAHHLNRAKAIDAHGAEWARVMWAFQLPATRCHNYDQRGKPKHYKPKTYETKDGTSKPLPMGQLGRLIDFD
jgi:SprT protein